MKARERFEQKFEKKGPDECWPWTGSKTGEGYGQMVLKGKIRRAHRIMYTNYVGKIPKGKLIRHLCNNPACVNPKHLAVGTDQDNMDDKVKAGRQPSHKGESNPKAKLTKHEVQRIRREYNKGRGVSQVALAFRYGVSPETIYDVVSGRTWKDV